MTSSADRMRLKDKILTNVARSIKAIQEYQLCTGESEIVLTNSSWHCHRLCEHLDHAFLHGLRHITHGYWKLVTEFTRKEAVKEISRLKRITTDLGRGRAWLFLALNENLLESYMRCFLENASIVKKYYVREALVLDHQRMNVLVTLTSGLDFASFQLEYDLPYLDLNASPPKSRSQSDDKFEEEDKVSLCSMQSFASRNSLSAISSSMIESTITVTDSDCASINSDSPSTQSDVHLLHMHHVGSLDSGYYCGSGGVGPPHRYSRGSLTMSDSLSMSSISSHTDDCRYRRIENALGPNVDGENNLEVIHVKSKVLRRKKVKSNNRRDQNAQTKGNNFKSVANTMTAISNTITAPRSTTTTTVCRTLTSKKEDLDVNTISKTDNDLKICDNMDKPDGLGLINEKTESKEDMLKPRTDQNEDKLDNKTCENETNSECLPPVISEKQTLLDGDSLTTESPLTPQKGDGSTTDVEPQSSTDDALEESYGAPNPVTNNTVQEDEENLKDLDMDSSHYAEVGEDTLNTGYNADTSSLSGAEDKAKDSTLTPCGATDFEEDIYSPPNGKSKKDKSAGHQHLCMTDDIYPPKLAKSDSTEKPSEKAADVLEEGVNNGDAGEILLDNHILLYLMLEILDENERFLKMFVTREGQNEGQSSHICVVVTDRSIYLLKQNSVDHRFIKESVIPFRELDYISLCINSQVIGIVCANRRRQFWLTTGDEEVTRSIISCLSHAMEASPFNIPKLSVLTDATAQQIAMKKYLAQETKSSIHEVEIHSYHLIHWEDAQPGLGTGDWTHKEGYLLYRAHDSYFRNYIWKPGYFILKDGCLCMYTNKTDSKPAAFVNLSSEECTGCRRATDSDKEHTIEIVITHGHNWYIAAATAIEANDWRQSLCQAVSEVMMNQGQISSSCLACCVILSQTKIFMCHEDLQTNFFRTLGSANVEDVTAVLTTGVSQAASSPYCVMEFESQEAGVTTDHWILYFNAVKERIKFVEMFSHCWKKLFQIDLPVTEMEDAMLERKCNRRLEQLMEPLQIYS